MALLGGSCGSADLAWGKAVASLDRRSSNWEYLWIFSLSYNSGHISYATHVLYMYVHGS